MRKNISVWIQSNFCSVIVIITAKLVVASVGGGRKQYRGREFIIDL